MREDLVDRRESSTTLSGCNLEGIANSLIGIPYTRLGRDPDIGLDCWGLVIEFYRRMGVQLEDPVSSYTEDWWKQKDYVSAYADREFDKIDNPEAGAVMTMKVKGSDVHNHMAVLLSDSEVINSQEIIGVHRIKLYAIRHLSMRYTAAGKLI